MFYYFAYFLYVIWYFVFGMCFLIIIIKLYMQIIILKYFLFGFVLFILIIK